MRPSLLIGLTVLLVVGAACGEPPQFPPADTGVGLFYNITLFADRSPEAVRGHIREMVAAGCTTFTLYMSTPEESAMQIDTAIEEGLITDFPIVLLVPVGRQDQYLADVRTLSKYVDRWPEMVVYGPDEAKADEKAIVISETRQAHEIGRRLCLTTFEPLVYAGVTDIVVPIDYHCDESVVAAIEAAGSEFWAYSVGPFHYPGNYYLTRFIAGLWRWKTRPASWFAWSYMDIQGDTPAMRGLTDGCFDYRILRMLEAALAEHDHPEGRDWLEGLRASIPWNPYAGIPGPPPKCSGPCDTSLPMKTGLPLIGQMDCYRQWAGYYLAQVTGCEQMFGRKGETQ